MSADEPVNPLRVLVHAPVGRDATLTAELLGRAGIPCHVCPSMDAVCAGISEGAGAVVLTEEALSDPAVDALAGALEAQPAWSDISVLLFAGYEREASSLRAIRKLEILRNVTLLERPMRTAAVISTVQAALRGRQRQYELREVLLALHHARREAEGANRLKDEFLATLSHELRTPLNAVLGWLAMLRQNSVSKEQVPRVLEVLERNASAQAQLIADVLDMSRMITGKIRLQLQPVSISQVTADAVDSIRPAAEAKGVALHVDASGDGLMLNADPERLQQVLWNLLSNAVKFTPSGGEVRLRAFRSGPLVQISVTDNGAGLTPEFLPFVFDRFRQADQSFTRATGGLGIGLAIVKHLVEMHGGEVRADSDGRGRGATFHVQLPISGVPARAHAGVSGTSAPAPSAGMQAYDFGGRRIVVLEDDAASRELLVAMLEQAGARVFPAASVREAFEHIGREVPELIVADIGMPEEDGISFVRRLRRRGVKEGGAVPAIALSAYARAEDRQAALGAGFDEFVTKPAPPATVLSAIERALADR